MKRCALAAYGGTQVDFKTKLTTEERGKYYREARNALAGEGGGGGGGGKKLTAAKKMGMKKGFQPRKK